MYQKTVLMGILNYLKINCFKPKVVDTLEVLCLGQYLKDKNCKICLFESRDKNSNFHLTKIELCCAWAK